MDVLTFLWQIGVILALVLGNGFFVAAEFALVKIRASQLKPLLKSKDWRVPIAIRVTKRLDAYLSATQLGITLTSLGLGWLGEPYLARWIEIPLHDIFGITDAGVVHSIAYAVAFAIITFLHIVLGELAPKSLAIQAPKPVTLWVAAPLITLYYIFFPFIWVLNGAANLLLRMCGLTILSEGDHTIGHEELQYVLSHSHHAHSHDELINKIMIKALRLKETRAEQIMLPVEKVVVLWRDKPVEEAMALFQRSGYSRLPLCGQTTDEVLGVIHSKEFVWQYLALGAQTKLIDIVRPILTFTPKTKLPTMLELFRNSRNHMAVVIDANDSMIGIVSFEDVLEELVGDIRDEFDIEKGPFFERTADMVLIDSELPLRDLAAETGWPLPTHTTDTVEKWLLHQWGAVPRRGESIELDGVRYTAEQVSARGIRRVRAARLEPAKSDDGETG